ncbi:MAG TPA: chemotaxis protein CheW [Anaerovoracaceae bacterium]|nr:chemotaxis protein CheW [Anaerovoracaceae bacterium]
MEVDKELFGNEDTQKNKYLIFSIGNESYGIRIKYVIEIISIVKITRVPGLPNYVKGIINLRGKIISIMDVRQRFKKEEKEYDDRTCIIVMDIDGNSFGLIVDIVKEVASIDESNITPPPKIINQEDIAIGFIEGIGKMENDNLLFIDCMKLLNYSTPDQDEI